mmetsp:Transcript_106983/g.300941  ORF Transcript_106983/g.300941 Transcript_106983/m.300941 type:complete len:365 (+) Transcript_106983:68-1162(+)|eukprot:CAMPEP_0117549790 /NCGR_PEP_ID=MMETSP0784-20121206/48348_1 /TAXON_ID=39447 /ORGANISM="" /LENGTH=364 /DNA_ID=CAMNT_0005346791 /DNA_START=11 /DNA_END=1105 /DNA_ORIENTATION=-
MISKSTLIASYAAAVSASPNGNFVAINDLVPAGTTLPNERACTWTFWTHGRNSGAGEPGGLGGQRPLFDTSGKRTDATLELVEKTTHDVMTINNAKNKVKVKMGTPAWEEYASCLCDEEKDCDKEAEECECDAFDGNLSYNDAPDWELRYIFSGLDPSCEAEVSFFVERGGGTDYDSRYSEFTLEGAKIATAQASLALASLHDGSTLALRSGQNSEGHIAKWTGVKHDGTFVVVATHGSQALVDEAGVSPPPHPFKGYAGGLLKLRQVCTEETASENTTFVMLIVGAIVGFLGASLAAFVCVARRCHTKKSTMRAAVGNVVANPNPEVVTGTPVVGKADSEVADNDNNSIASTKTPSSRQGLCR